MMVGIQMLCIFLFACATELSFGFSVTETFSLENLFRKMETLEKETVKMKHFEEEIKELKTEMKELRKIVHTQNKKIVKQDGIVKSLKELVQQQHKRMSAQEKMILSLQTILKQREEEIVDKKGILLPESKEHDFSTNSNETYHRKPNFTQRNTLNQDAHTHQGIKMADISVREIQKRQPLTEIAFEAYLEGEQDNVPVGHVLRMGHVTLNVGNAYNKNDGIFVAPVEGLYMFYCQIMPISNKQAYVEFKINGSSKNVVHAYSHEGYQTSSGLILAHLNANDHVWLEIVYFTSSLHGHYNLFSGVLLYEV